MNIKTDLTEIELLTVAQAAAIMRVSTATVKNYVTRGKLRGEHIDQKPRMWLLYRSDVLEQAKVIQHRRKLTAQKKLLKRLSLHGEQLRRHIARLTPEQREQLITAIQSANSD